MYKIREVDAIDTEMKDKSLRKATGLVCAALIASNDKARTHKKITRNWLRKK